jgi:hypothetical protein
MLKKFILSIACVLMITAFAANYVFAAEEAAIVASETDPICC